MTVHRAYSKPAAVALARIMRKKGFTSGVYKVRGEKGYRISVSRGLKR